MLLHSLYCYQESSHTADTLLLSRVHHVGSIADCARKPGARSSVYYRALPRTVDGGSPGARGHTCIYIRHPRSHAARLLASLRSAIKEVYARSIVGYFVAVMLFGSYRFSFACICIALILLAAIAIDECTGTSECYNILFEPL